MNRLTNLAKVFTIGLLQNNLVVKILWQIVLIIKERLSLFGEKSLDIVKINQFIRQYKIPETLIECSVNFLREFGLVLIISIINRKKERLSIILYGSCWKKI